MPNTEHSTEPCTLPFSVCRSVTLWLTNQAEEDEQELLRIQTVAATHDGVCAPSCDNTPEAGKWKEGNLVWLTAFIGPWSLSMALLVVWPAVHCGGNLWQRTLLTHGSQETNKRKEGLGSYTPFKGSPHLPHFLPLGFNTSIIAIGWGHMALGEISGSYHKNGRVVYTHDLVTEEIANGRVVYTAWTQSADSCSGSVRLHPVSYWCQYKIMNYLFLDNFHGWFQITVASRIQKPQFGMCVYTGFLLAFPGIF